MSAYPWKIRGRHRVTNERPKTGWEVCLREGERHGGSVHREARRPQGGSQPTKGGSGPAMDAGNSSRRVRRERRAGETPTIHLDPPSLTSPPLQMAQPSQPAAVIHVEPVPSTLAFLETTAAAYRHAFSSIDVALAGHSSLKCLLSPCPKLYVRVLPRSPVR